MTGNADADNQANKPIIVGIGASAGGVQALQTLFGAIPNDTGAAFIVVLHLDPQAHSALRDVLASRTKMPVEQVEGSTGLQPNKVYVIGPDRRLEVTDHQIASVQFDEPEDRRASIDLLFRSMADRLGDGCAIILSGAGSDGAIGARAVKESGGIIMVQDPEEAEYSSMPRSAIATGIVDFVLPTRDLAARLVELLRSKSVMPAMPAFDEELLRRVLAHLRVRTGHDFSKYKRSTVLRRIGRRMQVTRTDTLRVYYEFLRDNAEEAQALLGDLLISVTTFFRDAEVYETLKSKVLAPLLDSKDPTEPIRIWVPGCATGEEAYSIAMVVLEMSAGRELRPPIQLFGSDLDVRALAIAREGRYPAAIETDVKEERLRRFFTSEGDHYRVRQELRDPVLFAVHDLLKDPPFSRVDFVSCRNLMIYLDRELQEQVISTFHYALNPGGFLLLGSSETADNPVGLFRSIDRNARIYQSTAHAGDKPRLLPRLLGGAAVREHVAFVDRPHSPTSALNEAAMHRRAIEQLAPPSALVDESHRVIHLSENAGRFIQPAGGPMTGDIVDLVRQELRFELRSALHRAFEQQLDTVSLPILVRFNGAPHRVHLHVRPTSDELPMQPRSAVVMFIEGEAVDEKLAAAGDQQTNDESVRRLTQELELTRSRLRTTREESEAANEELRAANEELQSINEEYRSTSEELETSKEELQSINEELQTVNTELKLKLETISRAHSDLQNLMAATDFGTLFLDSTLRIKRFTDRVTELFSITPMDEGRPITDFAHQLAYDDLIRDMRTVLSELAPIRREVAARNGRSYDVRMRPYRTVDDRIDGVVITFVDNTDRRHTEEALRESERQLSQQKHLVELSREPMFIWRADDDRIIAWNRGSEELYGYSRDEAMGRRKNEMLGTVVSGSSFADLKSRLLASKSWTGELLHKTKDGRTLTVESRLETETFGDEHLVLETARDVTDRKRWEQRQHLLLRELSHRVRNTLTVVQAIAHQTLRGTKSTQEFVERFDGRLAALAGAHNLLIDSHWIGADFEALVREQLAPYMGDSKRRVVVNGPSVVLPADIATPFGLVLHELATNASKHGALSKAGGTVELRWRRGGNAHRDLEVIWRERGGPPVKKPGKPGLGSSLIGEGIPNATVKREFNPDGLVCTIRVPMPEPAQDGP